MPVDDLFESRVARALRRSPNECPDLVALHALAWESTGHAPQLEGVGQVAHVAGCQRCRSILIGSLAPAKPVSVGPAARWERLQRRADEIFTAPNDSIMKVVVRAVRGILELVDVVGDLVEPVPVRNENGEGLVVRREFGSHELTAHIAQPQPGQFSLTVDLWSDGSPTDELRITLLRERRELNSALPRRGRVSFGVIGPGNYRVSVAGRRERVGAIDIELEAHHP